MDLQEIGAPQAAEGVELAPVVDQVLVHEQEQEDPAVYVCACRGFRSQRLEDMCLRCLDAYATGIQMLLSPERLRVEMHRVAACLQRHLHNGPRVTVGEALKAADRGLAPPQRPRLELA